MDCRWKTSKQKKSVVSSKVEMNCSGEYQQSSGVSPRSTVIAWWEKTTQHGVSDNFLWQNALTLCVTFIELAEGRAEIRKLKKALNSYDVTQKNHKWSWWCVTAYKNRSWKLSHFRPISFSTRQQIFNCLYICCYMFMFFFNFFIFLFFMFIHMLHVYTIYEAAFRWNRRRKKIEQDH